MASVQREREVLGGRLREPRRRSGLTGAVLAKAVAAHITRQRTLYDQPKRFHIVVTDAAQIKGTRPLTCWFQALFEIAWFSDIPNIIRHGAAFGLSQSTAYRYLPESSRSWPTGFRICTTNTG